MSRIQRCCVTVWFCTMLICWHHSVEAQQPPLVADADLVGNVYGTVNEQSTGKAIAGVSVVLLESPLQRADAYAPDALNSNKGWFGEPLTDTAVLRAMTDIEGKFLINSVRA